MSKREIEARYDGAPALVLRQKAEAFVALLEQTEEAISGLDPGLRQLIDMQLERHARSQGVECKTHKSAMTLWTRSVTDLIGVLAGVGRQLEVVPVQGERNTAYRQMVRGVAELVLKTTGVAPRRSVKRMLKGGPQEEDYWFLRFCRRLAALAYERAPSLPIEIENQSTTTPEGMERDTAKAIECRKRSDQDASDKTQLTRQSATQAAFPEHCRKLVGPPIADDGGARGA